MHQALGDVAFQSDNLLGFLLSVLFVGQSDVAVQLGGLVRGGGVFGPGEHSVQRALLEANLLLAEVVAEACQALLKHGVSATEVTDETKSDAALPELVESGGIAGQRGVEVLTDLTGQRRSFADQSSPVP